MLWFTIGFYDEFKRLLARTRIQSDNAYKAISKAALQCGVNIAIVGWIEIERP